MATAQKTSPKARKKPAQVKRPRSTPGATEEVLTLAEASAYLRVTDDVLAQLAVDRAVPARKVGGEWRFLRPALQDWLRGDETSSKERMLALAGSWKDDPALEEMVREIYRRRGRPMTEEDE